MLLVANAEFQELDGEKGREKGRGGGGGGEGERARERERENSNSKILFYKDCSLGSFKNLPNNQSLLSC